MPACSRILTARVLCGAVGDAGRLGQAVEAEPREGEGQRYLIAREDARGYRAVVANALAECAVEHRYSRICASRPLRDPTLVPNAI